MEAEAVALARWEATELRPSKKQRTQEALLAQAEELIARRWAATSPAEPRDIQAQLASDGWPAAAKAPTYRLFDTTGQPIRCHLCGRDHAWMPEGDGERQTVRMFVCEHEPLRLGSGLVRQVSTVSLHRVMRCEAIHADTL
jgi:hypothetical protein